MAVATKARTRGRQAEDVEVEAADVVSLPRVNQETGDVEFEDVPLSRFPEQVGLVSHFAELHVPLIPRVTYDHRITGRTVVEQEGLTLHFKRNRYTIPREYLPVLAQHPAFTGRGMKACVYLEDDVRAATVAENRPRITDGTTSSIPGTDQALAPIRGWDTMSPAEIKAAADAGQITDPMSAMAFEYRPVNGRRREAVKLTLWRLEAGADAEVPVEPIADDTAEPMPADARKE